MDIFKRWADNSYSIVYRKLADNESTLFAGNQDEFSILMPSLRYWYADPILYNVGNRMYVFMEVYDRIKRKGMIGVSRFDKRGKLGRPVIIIREDFHLSFPEIFEYNGQIYLLPESNEINQIRIYRMEGSMLKWKLYYSFTTKERYSDTVVYVKEQNIYLLSTSKDPEDPYKNRLAFFKIKNLEDRDNICYCLLNEADIFDYESRNGGSLLDYKGVKYRVIQTAEPGWYGKDIKLRKVLQCDVNAYRESSNMYSLDVKDIPVRKLSWKNRIRGIHTYGLKDSYEVLDINMYSLSLIQFFRYYLNIVRYYIKK